MKRYEGNLSSVGSWTGQPGSDGGRLESIDVGPAHIRKLGCTAYMHDMLTLNVGSDCTLYVSAPLGTSLGAEVLGIRFADGRSRVAGKARVVKVAIACAVLLPIVGCLFCACPVGMALGAMSGHSKFMGVVTTLIVVAIILACIVVPIWLAVNVLKDYASMALSLGQDPNVKKPTAAPPPPPTP